MGFYGRIFEVKEDGKMVQIVVARPEDVEGLWPSVKPFLDPAIDKDFFHDENTLKAACIEDRALLFIALVDGKVSGAAITQVEKMKISLVNILSLGGKNFKAWGLKMNEALTIYAAHIGCKYIVANASPGWSRLWPDFKAGNTLYLKEIF